MLKMTASIFLASLIATTASANADQSPAAPETMTRLTVEMGANKKPPFKRGREQVEVVDIAAMETDATVETVKVRTVATGANKKAPFKREVVELPVTDIAAMEITEGKKSAVDFRGKPPFNRHQ